MSSTTSFKVTCGSDTRRLRLDAASDFKAFASAIQSLFFPANPAAQFSVTWTDEDGDVVTVAGDADFAEAKRVQHGAKVVRFAVTATSPPPYPPAAPTAGLATAPTAAPPPKAVHSSGLDVTATATATAKPTKAFLSMLVDRSGSMRSLGGEVLAGIQTYLEEMKASDAEDGSSTSVLMATFDNKYELAHDGLDLPDALKAIKQSDIEPRGMTALWDGIGFVLRDTEARIAALPSGEKPDKVIIFILTDGRENSSSTWSQATVKRRMDALKLAPHGYEFFFAAAGQDALATGSHMGLKADECVTWSPDPAAARETFRSSAVNAVRCKRGQSRGYTKEQRSSCMTPQKAPSGGGSGGFGYGRRAAAPSTTGRKAKKAKVKAASKVAKQQSSGAVSNIFGALNPFSSSDATTSA